MGRQEATHSGVKDPPGLTVIPPKDITPEGPKECPHRALVPMDSPRRDPPVPTDTLLRDTPHSNNHRATPHSDIPLMGPTEPLRLPAPHTPRTCPKL